MDESHSTVQYPKHHKAFLTYDSLVSMASASSSPHFRTVGAA